MVETRTTTPGNASDPASGATSGTRRERRIAVIGSGIAGTTASWWMATAPNPDTECRVSMFEVNARVGLDQHAADVKYRDGRTVRVDMPMQAFWPRYYPNLVRMYDYIGVPVVKEERDFALVRQDGSLSYAYLPFDRSWILGFPIRPWSWTLVKDLIRFCWTAPKHYDNDAKYHLTDRTFGEYLTSMNYSSDFVDGFLLQWLAAIATCRIQAVREYPADVMVRLAIIVLLGGQMHRRRVNNRELGLMMTRHLAAIRTSVKVTKIERVDASDNGQGAAGWRVTWAPVDAAQADSETCSGVEMFDDIVFACPPRVALALLPNQPWLTELKQLLGYFDYDTSRNVTHYDESIVPLPRKDWTSIMYTLGDTVDRAPMATLWMDRMSSIEADCEHGPIFQSWNPVKEPAADKILSDSTFHRPIVTLSSAVAAEQLPRFQGKHGLWFAGGYTERAVPLFEQSIASGLRVAEQVTGQQRPWGPVDQSPPSEALSFAIRDRVVAEFKTWAIVAAVAYSAVRVVSSLMRR